MMCRGLNRISTGPNPRSFPNQKLYRRIKRTRIAVLCRKEAMSKERTTIPVKKVAFQGKPGAYSQLACSEVFPERTSNPCEFFEDTFQVLIHSLPH